MEIYSFQFSSVTQSCPTLCDPMNRPPCPSPTPRVYSCPLSRWCHLTILFHPLLLLPSISPNIMSQFFASGSQSIGVSASISVLPMNTQNWFPLGWTDWIFLESKGLSRVFSSTTVHPTLFPFWNDFFVPCLFLTTAFWTSCRFLRRQVRWFGNPNYLRIFQSLLWSTKSKALS